MRLQRFITETEEASGAAPDDQFTDADFGGEKDPKDPKDGKEGEKGPELSPEEQEAQDTEAKKLTDITSIVDTVVKAVDKNGLNSAVKKAAPLYKQYGDQWLTDLKKAMSIDVTPEMVSRFMEIVKNFSDKLTHLK